jgi:histidinol-phosphate aminotransferase
MSEIEQLIRPHLLDLKPYASARDEYTGDANVFLDANENPFGFADGQNWNRYPDPYQLKLKEKISQIKEIAAENVFLGNGSDEPIDLLIRLFCEPGRDKVASLVPTYGMYKVSADIHNVETVEIPLDEDFQFHADAISDEAMESVKIFFICSPNNPSGNLLDPKVVLSLISRLSCIVVIDEAYIDFRSDASLLHQIQNYPNLVILQTFSKAWGMAAYRLGMAFASPTIIQWLNKIKAPYNLNGPIQELALHALDNSEKVDAWISEIQIERSKLEEKLMAHPRVEKVFPSDANFLLVRFKESQGVFQYLKDSQIIVRDRSSVRGCSNCLRITVGTSEENAILLEKLNELKD